MPMTAADHASLAAKITAVMPAIRAIGDSCGRLVQYHRSTNSSIKVEISMSNGSPIEIYGDVRYGSEWHVKASGASWEAVSADELAVMGRVLSAAASIVAILKTIDLATLR